MLTYAMTSEATIMKNEIDCKKPISSTLQEKVVAASTAHALCDVCLHLEHVFL